MGGEDEDEVVKVRENNAECDAMRRLCGVSMTLECSRLSRFKIAVTDQSEVTKQR